MREAEIEKRRVENEVKLRKKTMKLESLRIQLPENQRSQAQIKISNFI